MLLGAAEAIRRQLVASGYFERKRREEQERMEMYEELKREQEKLYREMVECREAGRRYPEGVWERFRDVSRLIGEFFSAGLYRSPKHGMRQEGGNRGRLLASIETEIILGRRSS